VGPDDELGTVNFITPASRKRGGTAVADDIVIMPLQCATQSDSLAHVGYDSRAYNDVPYSAVTAAGGAARNSFPKVAEHLVGRGVLLDIPGLNEAGRLEPDYEATAGDLTAAKENLRIESGDRPSRDPTGLPFHMAAIRDMGLQLGEMFKLEDLAAACADRGAWDSPFAGPGLKITGSVGSPVAVL
jgi:hypothetical protein